MKAWIGVDFDGTLVTYDGWKGADTFGEPIKPMVDRVRELIAAGQTVKIMTARAYPYALGGYHPESVRWNESRLAVRAIKQWCQEHLGQELEVTCVKDFGMTWLYDDRAISVEKNTGKLLVAEPTS